LNNLNKKITQGIGWTSLSTFGRQGLRLVIKLILAKMLLPEHYGLIGMASVFTGFIALISELGMAAALIQKPKEELHENYFHTAFWTNLAVSVAAFIAMAGILGPTAAWFYEEDILISLIPVMTIPMLIDAIYLVPRVQLIREMDFKPSSVIEIVSVVLAGICSIVLALLDFGVWALAFNGIIISFTSIIGYYFINQWRPKFIFDKASFKSLWGFGGYVMGERIFTYFTSNIDYILIGKLIGSSALGVYTLAFILTDAFRKQVMGLLTKVLFPAYSSIQKQKGKLKSYYLGVIKINSLVLFPIMTIFIVLAEPIILLGFGDQWQEAVFPLQILSIGVIVHAISGTSTTVMKSLGKADLVMKLNMFITIFITAPFISVGAVFFGIKGVAVGVLLFKIFGYAIYQHFIEKVIGVSIIQAMRQLVGLTLCCALIGISIVLLKQYVPMQPALQLVTGLVITGSFYLFYLFRFEKEWIEQVRKIIPSKKIKTAGT
jgi:O-antigen/teichoic acid export membrane protein